LELPVVEQVVLIRLYLLMFLDLQTQAAAVAAAGDITPVPLAVLAALVSLLSATHLT
jgi:hypothetical protein